MPPAGPTNGRNPIPASDNACIPERAAYLRAVALRQCKTGVHSMPDDPALVRQWRLIKIASGNRYRASQYQCVTPTLTCEASPRSVIPLARRSLRMCSPKVVANPSAERACWLLTPSGHHRILAPRRHQRAVLNSLVAVEASVELETPR